MGKVLYAFLNVLVHRGSLYLCARYIRHGRSNLPVHDCENVIRSGPAYGSGVGHGSGAEEFGPGGTLLVLASSGR